MLLLPHSIGPSNSQGQHSSRAEGIDSTLDGRCDKVTFQRSLHLIGEVYGHIFATQMEDSEACPTAGAVDTSEFIQSVHEVVIY